VALVVPSRHAYRWGQTGMAPVNGGPMRKTGERLWMLVAALLAISFCYVWAGPVAFSPTSVEWLNVGDRAMHTLGWWFFREAPWAWPPGASPKLGLELASGVALSDSLPLFAFPFKLASPLLPPTFQYWGFWYLLCFALQACFGFLIARELNLGRGMAFAAALFCVFQPAFLDRIPGHMALGGHWTILAALFMYVRRDPPPRFAWPLLLGVVALVHGYLMAMCGAIWLTSLAQRLWLRRIGFVGLAAEVACSILVVVTAMWMGGFFMVRSFGSGGYGFYQLNLLALIDPSGWSYLFPDLPETPGDYEGLNFMGAGVLLLIAATFVAVRFHHAPQLGWAKLRGARWLPIVVLGVGLTLFAMTNKLAVGNFELPAIPLPTWVTDLAAVFRASARMFWPVGYLLLFAVLLAANRALGRRVLWFVLPLLLVQVADSSARWAKFYRREAPTTEWSTSLQDPAWDALAERYERIRGVPVEPIFWDWKELSLLALRHHIGLDAAYLARVDAKSYEALRIAGIRALAEGEFDTGAIYVMRRGAALLARRHMQPGDLLAEFNGRWVFARGGKDRLRDARLPIPDGLPQALPLEPGIPVATVEANRAYIADYMLSGWSDPENWGTWTDGMEATLVFSIGAMPNPVLHLIAAGLPQPDGSPQRVTVLVNGEEVDGYNLSERPSDVVIPLPAGLAGEVFMTFRLAGPSRPSDHGGSDTRLLGMALRSIELRSE